MDLNLNQEQVESPNGPMLREGSLLHELEPTHGCIEERTGRLEPVTSRVTQHPRQIEVQTSPQLVNNSLETAAVNAHGDGSVLVEASVSNFQQRPAENDKVTKRYNPDLVAKALGVDANTKESNVGGGFFDCNICLKMARDPVLTSCGHLFCWPCLHELSCAYSNVKECPVCNGEVTDASITPVYGNGGNDNNFKSKLKESCLDAPPRPQAQRVESVRQQRIIQRVFPPIEESIQQLRSVIGLMSDQTQSPDAGDVNATSGNAGDVNATSGNAGDVNATSGNAGDVNATSGNAGDVNATSGNAGDVNATSGNAGGVNVTSGNAGGMNVTSGRSNSLPPTELVRNRHFRALQISRFLLQEATSFPAISTALSSAMDSAERLVGDLETFIYSHSYRRSRQASAHIVNRQLPSHVPAVVQPDGLTQDTAAEINPIASPSATLSRAVDVTANVVSLENQTTDTATDINSRATISPSSRRINESSGPSDVDAGISHSSRRRRLE